jgi:predicted nucleic acid-binding protein
VEVRRIILDTSAYSAFMRGHEGLTRALQEVDEIALNPIILGELRAGFLLGRHRRKNEDELERFSASPRVRVIPMDEDTSVRYAVIVTALRGAGTPIPTNDVWIAATAMQHGLGVFTTDPHYEKVPQIIVERFSVP